MFTKIFTSIFGTSNDRFLKKVRKTIQQINALEKEISSLSDEQLKAKTKEFKERIKNGEKLQSIMPQAFAVVREASKRVLKMRPYDVQLIGGIVLVDRNIAEMRTGEGKTLTATIPCYLQALTGNSVHVVTVNDYLAKRDAETNTPLFNFLGLTVGVNVSGMSIEEKKQAYSCDITYSTNSELGFDYLRDNLAHSKEQRIQRGLYYALVDEVDSILIDEARTPLIISGAVENTTNIYQAIDSIIPKLILQEKEDSEEYQGNGDFTVDLKSKQAYLTENGMIKVEKLLIDLKLMQQGESLYHSDKIALLHYVSASLRAHHLFEKNVDYIVDNNEVVIIDEHTGRTMEGRRWSDGLHQAIEAKEKVTIQNENQTVASITYQNYFRMYQKLAGMTGTADTEALEFQQIYGLHTVVIPTNLPIARKDHPDVMFKSESAKFNAIIKDIQHCLEKKQPVLVGTASVEKSELLSQLLTAQGIKHNVLNAKHHQKEAQIIADAGLPGNVTIATNMAGRGTDIVLGGNWKSWANALENPTPEKLQELQAQWQQNYELVKKAGGLHIIGTERHESRRIDNQLRGRAGRQGDPGSSRFYLSLDDNLIRIYLNESRLNMMKNAFKDENEALESKLLTKVIASAQAKVEAYNFDARKGLLQYDDIISEQRAVIYQQRNYLLDSDDISETINNIWPEVIKDVIAQYIPPESMEEMWQAQELEQALEQQFALQLPIKQWLDADRSLDFDSLSDKIIKITQQNYAEKVQVVGAEAMRSFEKGLMLQTLDELWREHLNAIDYLRKGIHLRSYGQKDPKQEYKKESFAMFSDMLHRLKLNTISVLNRVQIRNKDEASEEIEQNNQENNFDDSNISRNSPCPCGSNKKYKHCHGSKSKY